MVEKRYRVMKRKEMGSKLFEKSYDCKVAYWRKSGSTGLSARFRAGSVRLP